MPNIIAHFALPPMRKHNAAASNPHLSSESPERVSLRRCGWDALMRKPSRLDFCWRFQHGAMRSADHAEIQFHIDSKTDRLISVFTRQITFETEFF